jgi:hypothetical protein
MSIVSPPKGGADVQDALISTQRNPKYGYPDNKGKYSGPNGQIDQISDYVRQNLGKNVQKRFEEHR